MAYTWRPQKCPLFTQGEILIEEFLKPMKLSQNRLADALGVNPRRVSEIVNGKRRITADTALRLARFFGMTARFWLNLQVRYDLDVAEDDSAARIEREVQTREMLAV